VAWNDDPQPTLRTSRLVLRPFEAADGPRVELLAGDRAIADTTALIPHPYPAGGGAEWIAGHPPEWARGMGGTWAVTTRADGLVGAMGLSVHPLANSAELGYWIGVPFWGRGYATEAASAVVHLAFELIGVNRVSATYLARNPASGRVMEKLGMQPEGVLRQSILKWGVYEDLALRSILRSEWEAARN
jgi:RimJ/RimL family protein N-acetyltransferase